MTDIPSSFIFKASVLGFAGAGKTAFISQLVSNQPVTSYRRTQRVESFATRVARRLEVDRRELDLVEERIRTDREEQAKREARRTALHDQGLDPRDVDREDPESARKLRHRRERRRMRRRDRLKAATDVEMLGGTFPYPPLVYGVELQDTKGERHVEVRPNSVEARMCTHLDRRNPPNIGRNKVEDSASLRTVAKGQMPMLSKAAQYHKLQMRKKGLTEEELEPLDDKNDNALAQGRVSNALIIVFDLSNPDSFHKARSLLDFVRPESTVQARDHRRTERSKTPSQLRVEEKEQEKEASKRMEQERERSRATSAMKTMLQRRRSTRELSMQNVIDKAREQAREESRRRGSAHSLGSDADGGGGGSGGEEGEESGDGAKGSVRAKWRRGLASVRAGLAISALRRRHKRGGDSSGAGADAGAGAGAGAGDEIDDSGGDEMPPSRLDSGGLTSLDTAVTHDASARTRTDSDGGRGGDHRGRVSGAGEESTWELPPPEDPDADAAPPIRVQRRGSSRRWRMSAHAISPPPSQRVLSGDRQGSRHSARGGAGGDDPPRTESQEDAAKASPAPASTGSATSSGDSTHATPPPSVRSLPSLDSLDQSAMGTPLTSDNLSLSPPSVRAEREDSSTDRLSSSHATREGPGRGASSREGSRRSSRRSARHAVRQARTASPHGTLPSVGVRGREEDEEGDTDGDEKEEEDDESEGEGEAMSPSTSTAGASLASMLSGRALENERVSGPDSSDDKGDDGPRGYVGSATDSSNSPPSRRGSNASLSSAVSGASQFSHPSRLHTPPGLPTVKTPDRKRVNMRVPILLFGNKLDRLVPGSEYAERIIYAAETLADSRPNVMFAFGSAVRNEVYRVSYDWDNKGRTIPCDVEALIHSLCLHVDAPAAQRAMVRYRLKQRAQELATRAEEDAAKFDGPRQVLEAGARAFTSAVGGLAASSLFDAVTPTDDAGEGADAAAAVPEVAGEDSDVSSGSQ